MSQIGKKLFFGSVVRVRQIVVMVRVRVSLQEINVSLCNVPKSDLNLGLKPKGPVVLHLFL